MTGLIPSGEKFPDRALQLAARLLPSLSLTGPIELEMLAELDRSILERVMESGESFLSLLRPDFIEPLLAYVGESVRKRIDCEWRMDYNEGETWVPWLVQENAKDIVWYNISRVVLMIYDATEEDFAIEAATDWFLRRPVDRPDCGLC